MRRLGYLAWLLLLCGSAWGALDATSTSATQAGVSSYSWTHTTGSGLSNSMLLVSVSIGDDFGNGETVSGITYNGVALTKVVAIHNGAFDDAELWCLLAPSSGANTIAVSLSASIGRLGRSEGVTLSGMNQSCIPDGSNSATGSSTSNTLAVTASATDFIVDAVGSHYNTGAEAFNASQTTLLATAAFSSFAGASYILSMSGSSQNMIINFGGTENFAHAVAAFKVSGGAAAPCQSRALMGVGC